MTVQTLSQSDVLLFIFGEEDVLEEFFITRETKSNEDFEAATTLDRRVRKGALTLIMMGRTHTKKRNKHTSAQLKPT